MLRSNEMDDSAFGGALSSQKQEKETVSTMILSIITINYNNYNGLKRTIDSVLQQSFTNFEWIVVDGGSTDGSRELIEEYQEHFSWWCSEPDKGIYNAMNKGIVKSNGEYLHFLNSGDCFCDKDTLSGLFTESIDADILYGNCIKCYTDQRIERRMYAKQITLNVLRKFPINHQCIFIKRDCFRDSLYDENYKIVSDWKKLIELMLKGRVFYHCGLDIVYYDMEGISSTHHDALENEAELMRREVIPVSIAADLDQLDKYEHIKVWNPELEEIYRFISMKGRYKKIIHVVLKMFQLTERL